MKLMVGQEGLVMNWVLGEGEAEIGGLEEPEGTLMDGQGKRPRLKGKMGEVQDV